MLTGVRRSAIFNPGRRYRFVMVREWDDRPRLVACMFNPSDANEREDDPTTVDLCVRAARNGYGSLVIVNGIPLVSPYPQSAAYMVTTWKKRRALEERDALRDNESHIESAVSRAADVLIAWGALAHSCPAHFDRIVEKIREAMSPRARLLCLGYTVDGYPKHPLARGVHRVPREAAFIDWKPRGTT